jgi:hypothetical protein
MRASSAAQHFVEFAKCFLMMAGGGACESALKIGPPGLLLVNLAGNSTTAGPASSSG